MHVDIVDIFVIVGQPLKKIVVFVQSVMMNGTVIQTTTNGSGMIKINNFCMKLVTLFLGTYCVYAFATNIPFSRVIWFAAAAGCFGWINGDKHD